MEEDKKKTNQSQQITIELTEDIAGGIYSNLVMISHSQTEFVIDFISLMPGIAKAKVKSRIIVTPEHAKRLLYALQENIKKYEDTFGEIDNTDDISKIPFHFGGKIAEA